MDSVTAATAGWFRNGAIASFGDNTAMMPGSGGEGFVMSNGASTLLAPERAPPVVLRPG